MSFERVLVWMAVVGVIGFALTLAYMLASCDAQLGGG
jgi:hypothetical protein